MKELDYISVIMSTYNEDILFLDKAVFSILQQSYRNFEFIIIVDDPQNSKIISFLQECTHRDPRIKVFVNESNMGLAKSLNKGLSIACGDYIARMDADDISVFNRLERELDYLKAHNYDMVFSGRIEIDENDQEIGRFILPPISDQGIKKLLERECIVTHPSVFIKKKVLASVGGYREFDTAQDYDLWLRLITDSYKIGCIFEPFVKYRIRPNAISKISQYKQYLTSEYIRELYGQRCKCGSDTFSKENYIQYLNGHRVFDKQISGRYVEGHKYMRSGIAKLQKKDFFGGITDLIVACCKHDSMKRILYSAVRRRIIYIRNRK